MNKAKTEKIILERIEELAELLFKLYPCKKEFYCEIIERAILEKIGVIKLDLYQLDFKEFYKKHLKGIEVFNKDDFTKNELEEIIEESCLSERDKSIAKMSYLNDMTHEEIAAKLGIDRKTVTRNLPKLKTTLKKQAPKFIADKK